MAPMVHGLEAKYFGKIRFSYLDADDPQTEEFQGALGFYYQPEIYLLDASGNVLQKWIGYTSEQQLAEAFAQYLPTEEVSAHCGDFFLWTILSHIIW